MRLRTWLAGLSMLVIAPAAEAQITYTFNGLFNNNIVEWIYDEETGDWTEGQTFAQHQLQMNFVVNRVGPINTPGEYLWQSCSVSIVGEADGASYNCQATQQFDPNGFGTGYSLVSAQFEWTGFDMGGGGGAFFFFDPGSFLANGVYHAIQESIPGPGEVAAMRGGITTFDEPASWYGSAGEGTLTVAGIGVSTVPEPSTWLLMAAGLGALVPVMRRRRA